jgi:hypothetical protein
MKPINSAKDANGKKVKVGDRVNIISIYADKNVINTGIEIKAMHHQGADGTILHFNVAPNPEYPYHFSHVAKRTIKC